MCQFCTEEGDRASCFRCGCTVCLDVTTEVTCHHGLVTDAGEILCEACSSGVDDELDLLDAADELLAEQFGRGSVDWDEYEYGLSPDGYPVGEQEEW